MRPFPFDARRYHYYDVGAAGQRRAAALGGGFGPLSVSPYVLHLLQPAYLGQGSAGATPVTADGDIIQSALNTGSKGGYSEQATLGSRPVYHTGGAKHWATFDGSNDWLQIDSLALTRPYAVYVALRASSGFFSRFIDGSDFFLTVDGNVAGGTTPFSLADPATAGISSTIPIAPDSDHVVAMEVRPNGQNSRISVDGEAWVEGNLQSAAGLSSLAMMGAIGSGGGAAGGNIYALMVCPILNDAQNAQTVTYFDGLMP